MWKNFAHSPGTIPIPNIIKDAVHEDSEEYDFIVAGGGTAGLVVAGRLAENPEVKVLVIEAGIGNPEDVPDIVTPATAFELRGGEHDWQYKCNMINAPDHQRIEMKNTRGKVLGGSSSLNYYTWLPGSAGIYDEWAAWGGESWKYENFKEYFKKSNTYHDDHGVLSPEIANKLGGSGPLHIAPADPVKELQPFREALHQAWESKGNQVTENIYSGEVNGLVNCVVTIHEGERTSSVAFIRGKPNVTIQASSTTRKILFENKVATGVQIQDKDGNIITYKAKKEVIISQGVFETPKLLMLSGIGPSDQLFANQVGCMVDSPNVGQNLMDHPIMPHVFKLKDGYGVDHVLLRQGQKQDVATAEYKKSRSGPWSSGLLELVGFPRIDERLKKTEEWKAASTKFAGKDPLGPQGQPHFEIDFVPMWASAFQWHFPQPASGDYLTVILDLLRPQSRGEVRLTSANPLHQPYINIGFLSNELDLVALREGLRFVDDVIMNGDGMKDIVEEDFPWPMPRDSDEEMREQILERASTGFHPCGTTRMASNISDGVVDGELKVFGVDKLRVIDASVIPLIPDCRIQAPVYAIAEKGADMIKASYPELYT